MVSCPDVSMEARRLEVREKKAMSATRLDGLGGLEGVGPSALNRARRAEALLRTLMWPCLSP